MSHLKKIYFDLDNLLVDAELIKKYLYDVAIVHDYSEEKAKEIYLEARSGSDGKVLISWDRYVEFVKKHLSADNREFDFSKVEELEERLKNDPRVICEGAKELLDFCVKNNIDFYLLTMGAEDWQKDKISLTGLDSYFPESSIIIAHSEGDKINKMRESLGENTDGEAVVLFNDKPDETGDLLKEFKRLVAFVRIDKNDKRYSEKDFFELEENFKSRVECSENLRDLEIKFFERFFKIYDN